MQTKEEEMKMAKNKLHNINARVNDSLKIRVQAYALKNHVSESEVLRLALKKFLQTNVAKAKRFVSNSNALLQEVTREAPR